MAATLPKRFPDRDEIAVVRTECERLEPGQESAEKRRLPGRVLGAPVGVTGSPARSRRGEPSLAVDTLELLAKNRRPLPDTFHGVTDVETRYRQRYLDLLVNQESRELFENRTRIVAAVRAYLDGEGFLEVETPILQPRYGGGFGEP